MSASLLNPEYSTIKGQLRWTIDGTKATWRVVFIPLPKEEDVALYNELKEYARATKDPILLVIVTFIRQRMTRSKLAAAEDMGAGPYDVAKEGQPTKIKYGWKSDEGVLTKETVAPCGWLAAWWCKRGWIPAPWSPNFTRWNAYPPILFPPLIRDGFEAHSKGNTLVGNLAEYIDEANWLLASPKSRMIDASGLHQVRKLVLMFSERPVHTDYHHCGRIYLPKLEKSASNAS